MSDARDLVVVAGGTTDEVLPVSDVAEDLELVARSPAEMRTAQARLAEWARQKISILERDLAELGTSLDVGSANGWNIKALDRQHSLCVKRINYYTKIQKAVEAGYCIVPNFPLDIFAIRTKRNRPLKDETDLSWGAHLQQSEAPPVGEGRYVSDRPTVFERTERKTNPEGKEIAKKFFFAEAFEEVEFPIAVAKPAVMSATAEAMALKCFDEIGVLPARRGKGDPVVCGIIYDPRQKGSPHFRARRVTFLLAWYLDTREL